MRVETWSTINVQASCNTGVQFCLFKKKKAAQMMEGASGEMRCPSVCVRLFV